jgi:pyruvate dehydrogenase E2 component (dihydrolipoamide acetyltransferase)
VLDLSGSDVPILAVWGSEDAIVPASHADNLPDHARVDIIDGKGHSVQMEAAGMVNRLVADFLRSVES